MNFEEMISATPSCRRPVVQAQVAIRQQAQADARVRNQIEAKFGQGKRRFSLARVMAKLAPTAETSIAITFLVMNLERRLTPLCFAFWPFFIRLLEDALPQTASTTISNSAHHSLATVISSEPMS
jgi:Transposase DDE domain